MYCPQNAWYVACWSSDIAAGAVMPRVLLDQQVALFRTEQGTVGALFDRCPHRFAPLSKGKVVAEALQCPYHGLEFDHAGACFHNPYGPPPRAAKVQSFPVEERHRAVWIWMGDKEKADPALIPDFNYLADAPDSAFSAGYLHVDAAFEVIIDNIMDLTHAEYLHANSIAGNGMVHKVRPVTTETDEGVAVRWSIDDIPLSPVHAKLHAPLQRADMDTRVDWFPPASMRLKNAIIPPGRAEAEGFIDLNAHLVTPESRTSTHYFFAASRNYRVDDTALNAYIAEMRQRVFSTEDEPMLAAVQKSMGESEFWDLRPLSLGVDEASVRVRRRLKNMRAEPA